ncbi:MAG: YdeI/OmpD-associated family protein [Dermatophilaceae bacterium]
MAVELPELLLSDATAWRDWLRGHHGESSGVWLVLHKKGGNVTMLTYDQALDEALCVGWIDGQVGRRDDASYRLRFTPRKPRSRWSARNVGHVARLVAAGRMQRSGQAAVDAAKADGRWDDAYAGPGSATIPFDFAAAIAASPAAATMLETLSSTNRYALIYRVNSVKGTATRANKIARFVEMLERGETLSPQERSEGLERLHLNEDAHHPDGA